MVTITEIDCDDSVCEVETVGGSGEMIVYDCKSFQIERIVECYRLVTDCIQLGDGQVEETQTNMKLKVPRYDDEELNELIKNAQLLLDEKRRYRDTIMAEMHIKWESMKVHYEAFNAKILELRAANRLVHSHREQIDHVQHVISKVKNTVAVEDIDSRISKAEYLIKNGSLCSKDEKKLIREIKQLKGMRVQLATNMCSPDEIQHALDQKDQIEELLESLNTELKTLKDEVSKAQVASNTLRKKYIEELQMGRELRAQLIAAEESCKEASAHLHSLKKHLSDKVERFMDKWNANEESRCNMPATQNTQDEPSCVFLNDMDQKVAGDSGPTPDKIGSVSAVTNLETEETVKSVEEQHSDDEVKVNVLEEVHQKVANVSVESISAVTNLETQKAVTSVGEEHSDDQVKENLLEEAEQIMKNKELIEPNETIEIKENEERYELMKEEIEIMEIKENEETDELMKEEIEARLKEKIQLEEEKVKASERKKRNAEKAQRRAEMKAQMQAEMKAQQEAQEKEKRRLKRLKKREQKRASQERKRAARDAASSSSIESKEFEIKNGNQQQRLPHFTAAVAIINKKLWRRCGNIIITIMILILSVFSVFHSSW